MSIIIQNSRLQHHTIIYTGLTGSTFFTIPSITEDFTDPSWLDTDLCLSEIGVAESQNKAQIRIGNNINTFAFMSDLSGFTTGSSSTFNYWTSGSTGLGSIRTNVSSGVDATGTYSTAIGHNNLASGIYSFVSGQNNIASGDTAFVHGTNILITGKYSVGLGAAITGTSEETVYVSNLNINKKFTPTGATDPSYQVGHITWDDNFTYVKTNAGWKRTALLTF